MKSISENIITTIAEFGILTIVFIGVTSCSSREENPGIENSGTVLKFKIAGVEGVDIAKVATASIGRNGSVLSPFTAAMAKENTVSLGEIDVLTSVTGLSGDIGKGLSASTSSGVSGGAMAATTPMGGGVKYRIQIYVAGTTTNPVADVVATAGTDPAIAVSSGQSYDWYVISTNDASPPAVTNGVVSGSAIANKDVLYAKSSSPVLAVVGENDLGVVFHRNTAKITVDLDTRGAFGKINNTTAIEVGAGTGSSFTSIIQTGDFNIFNNTYSNLQTVSAVTAANMVNTPGAQGDLGATKTASFYTVNTSAIPAGNLKVRLNALDITLDDTSTRSFAANTIIPYSNTAITPVLGSQYSITARMLESGIVVGGITWARTNLYYDGTAARTDKYRFHPDNEYTIASVLNVGIDGFLSLQLNGQSFNVTNEFWNWMAATPTGLSSDNVDPCSRVYPTGKWRMPTGAEFTALGQPDSNNSESPLLLGGSRLASVWNLDSGQTANVSYPAKSRNLFVPLFGYRTSSGNTITDSPGSLLSGVLNAGRAHYWSSTPVGTTDANYHTRGVTVVVVQVWGNATLGSGVRTEGRAIRCVRS
ncbi:hypothetical protein VO54_03296 [Elizabethkingia miricola]|nr:hypothetical protein VO54_03296 [Elizabethkingia miricola]